MSWSEDLPALLSSVSEHPPSSRCHPSLAQFGIRHLHSLQYSSGLGSIISSFMNMTQVNSCEVNFFWQPFYKHASSLVQLYRVSTVHKVSLPFKKCILKAVDMLIRFVLCIQWLSKFLITLHLCISISIVV